MAKPKAAAAKGKTAKKAEKPEKSKKTEKAAEKPKKAAPKAKAAAAPKGKAARAPAPPKEASRPLRKGEQAWPGRQVEDRFGSKASLVEAVRKLIRDDLLDDRLNEDKGLDRVSSKKLLRLHAIGTKVESEFGGRSGLIDAVVAAEKRTRDEGYRTRLERYATPRLLDLVQAARKRDKRANAA